MTLDDAGWRVGWQRAQRRNDRWSALGVFLAVVLASRYVHSGIGVFLTAFAISLAYLVEHWVFGALWQLRNPGTPTLSFREALQQSRRI